MAGQLGREGEWAVAAEGRTVPPRPGAPGDVYRVMRRLGLAAEGAAGQRQEHSPLPQQQRQPPPAQPRTPAQPPPPQRQQ